LFWLGFYNHFQRSQKGMNLAGKISNLTGN
jgi:hypothetical protein